MELTKNTFILFKIKYLKEVTQYFNSISIWNKTKIQFVYNFCKHNFKKIKCG